MLTLLGCPSLLLLETAAAGPQGAPSLPPCPLLQHRRAPEQHSRLKRTRGLSTGADAPSRRRRRHRQRCARPTRPHALRCSPPNVFLLPCPCRACLVPHSCPSASPCIDRQGAPPSGLGRSEWGRRQRSKQGAGPGSDGAGPERLGPPLDKWARRWVGGQPRQHAL